MKLISVNVSLPKFTEYKGKSVPTGIFKQPVKGPVHVGLTNLAGDGQADLRVHGGPDKAVYAYSLEHYAFWQQQLDREPFPYGQFGENLTITDLDESILGIGDHLQVGDALLAITQPRVPCFKLGITMGNKDMPKLFSRAARTGFYLKVLREGSVEAGDTVHLVQQNSARVPVKDLFRAWFSPFDPEAIELFKRAVETEELSGDWRKNIQSRLERNMGPA